jgi:hypothetical protein
MRNYKGATSRGNTDHRIPAEACIEAASIHTGDAQRETLRWRHSMAEGDHHPRRPVPEGLNRLVPNIHRILCTTLEISYVTPSHQADHSNKADYGGRRCKAAKGVRLRQDEGFRSLSVAGRFSQ